MRIMGLDWGEKRVGIALSDPLGWTAQGLAVIDNKGSAKALLNTIKEYAQKYDVELVVVGFPRNMNGSPGPQAEKIKAFAGRLSGAIGLPIELWDERLTTSAAEKLLIEADLSRARRRQVVDKMAAVLILQGYLDFLNRKKDLRDE
ncbi:MAG: putative Holliday junction resolvase [Pelotomaculum sp. PtaB.Bin104]|nr:MAG: putative Holliday junction resolvase [Pelotomaculum sp. PtaB.Bin104]